jgi:hypothetical protein
MMLNFTISERELKWRIPSLPDQPSTQAPFSRFLLLLKANT